MPAVRLEIHPVNPQRRFLERAVEILRNDGVIIYPTDTVYGLGCNVHSRKAIERIHRIKKLKPGKPLSFVCADLSHLSEYATVSKPTFRLLKHYLPGPYTFILEASREVPKLLLSRQKTVGIRVPDCKCSRELVKLCDAPIVSSSVDDRTEGLAGGQRRMLTDPDEIEAQYGNDVDLILDMGPLGGEASTVVSLIGDEPTLLRAGKGKSYWSDSGGWIENGTGEISLRALA